MWNIEFYMFSFQIFNLYIFYVNVNLVELMLFVFNNKMIVLIRVYLMKFNNVSFRFGSYLFSFIVFFCVKSGNRFEYSIDIFKCNIIV